MGIPQRVGTDRGEKKVLADINEYGWHVMNVVEDDGVFSVWPGRLCR